jgi:hypothetical protein
MNAKKACSFIVQSPWPIVQTNADVVFASDRLAVWNCGEKETSPAIIVKLESRKLAK